MVVGIPDGIFNGAVILFEGFFYNILETDFWIVAVEHFLNIAIIQDVICRRRNEAGDVLSVFILPDGKIRTLCGGMGNFVDECFKTLLLVLFFMGKEGTVKGTEFRIPLVAVDESLDVFLISQLFLAEFAKTGIHVAMKATLLEAVYEVIVCVLDVIVGMFSLLNFEIVRRIFHRLEDVVDAIAIGHHPVKLVHAVEFLLHGLFCEILHDDVPPY